MKEMNRPMDPAQPTAIVEDELHALVDGRLSATQQADLRVRLAGDPAAAAAYAALAQQGDALRGLHAQVLHEAVPAGLLRAASQLAGARRAQDPWWRWGGMAAALLLAFGVGWWSHEGAAFVLASRSDVSSGARRLAQADQMFVRQAALAHAVYVPELKHPVEVSSAQQEHLIQWLSKRLGKPLKAPQLSAAGYDLLGGRLLPGDAGARAQFMFQNAAGERVTLYLGALADGANAASTQETAFRFSSDGPVNSFYWMDHGFGYALAAQLPRDKLMALAQLVYQQL